MSIRTRLIVYPFVIVLVAGIGAYQVITDFKNKPFPLDLPLSQFDPATAAPLKETKVWKPKFPVIDIHSHPQQSRLTTDETIKRMNEADVRMVVDLEGSWGREGERFLKLKEQYDLKYKDRFVVFATLDLSRLGQPDYIQSEIKRLEQVAAWGAKGVKIFKQFGTNTKDSNGKLIPVDDERLAPVWDKIGELGFPVLIHTANPVSFWHPTDASNERYDELNMGGAWLESYYEKPGAVSYEDLLKQRENLIRRHPNTNFVAAHMAALGHNLKELGRLLNTYPNFYIDISDRTYELGRQPYTARAFFIKYQDRILFGTDLYPEADVYRVYYRFLETRDEYFDYPRHYYKHGRWKIYGLFLPDEVLQKVYNGNALRLLGLSPDYFSEMEK